MSKPNDEIEEVLLPYREPLVERGRWVSLDIVKETVPRKERRGFCAGTAARFASEIFADGDPEKLKALLAMGLELDSNIMGEVATAAHRFTRRSQKSGDHFSLYQEELARLRERVGRW